MFDRIKYRSTTWVPRAIVVLIPEAEPSELSELLPEVQVVD
jgi:hypothetical protein